VFVCVCLCCVVLLCCGFLSCFLLNGMKRSSPAFSRKKNYGSFEVLPFSLFTLPYTNKIVCTLPQSAL
jgi:hypothetical protein